MLWQIWMMWAFTLLVSNLRVCKGEFLSESIIWSADFRCLLSESKEMYFLWTNNIWTFWIPLVDGFSQYVNINRISFLTKLVGELSCCTMWLKSVMLDLVLLHYCVRVCVLELACSNTELCLLVLLSLSLSSSLSFVIIIMVMMLCQVHICSYLLSSHEMISEFKHVDLRCMWLCLYCHHDGRNLFLKRNILGKEEGSVAASWLLFRSIFFDRSWSM